MLLGDVETTKFELLRHEFVVVRVDVYTDVYTDVLQCKALCGFIYVSAVVMVSNVNFVMSKMNPKCSSLCSMFLYWEILALALAQCTVYTRIKLAICSRSKCHAFTVKSV